MWNLGVSHTLKRELQEYLNKNQFSKFELEKRALQIIFEPKTVEEIGDYRKQHSGKCHNVHCVLNTIGGIT